MKFTYSPGMMVYDFALFVVLCLSFLSCVSSCDYNCQDKPLLTPSRLVVKHGDPTSSACVVCKQACLPLEDSYDIETSIGKTAKNGTRVTWTVERMTEWDLTPMCYYNENNGGQCCSDLAVTVYKPPDFVYMMLNHSGPLTEGTEYTLQCSVRNVAPAKNLIVTFYRGQTLLGTRTSSHTTKEPVTESFSFSFNATREDHRGQFWCEAKLELGAEGPQPPPALKSNNNPTATVYYGPELKVPADPAPVDIIRGETLHLTCLAEANPSPSYNWTLPSNNGHTGRSNLTVQSVDFQDGGLYVCSVSANGKTINVRFDVKVQEPPESVLIINHLGPLTEGTEYTLQCLVLNIPPAKDLTVTLYRGHTLLGVRTSNYTTDEPFKETFSLKFKASHEDNGALFWCEAKLKPRPEVSQTPLVLESAKLRVIVHSEPKDLETTSKPTSDAPIVKLSGFIVCLTLLVSAF